MRKGKDPDPDPYLCLMDPDPVAEKHADPADPDPQHWVSHGKKMKYHSV
jgi:hypothetical protein